MTISNAAIIKKIIFVFLVFTGLYYGKEFLMPIFIGGVLATLFLPICKWLENKKVPKAIAVLLCMIALLCVFVGISSLIGWQLKTLSNDLPRIKQKGIELFAQMQVYIFNQLGISSTDQIQIIREMQPSFTNIVQVLMGSFLSIFTSAVFTMVNFFCILYYRNHIHQFILKITSSSEREEMEVVVFGTAKVSQQYLVGLSKMIVCLWIMFGFGFSIIGVKNALLFALLCGLLEIVPYIGNITGTILTVFVAAVQGAAPPLLAGIIGVYMIVQFIQGWILEPLIVGTQVKINPYTTITALVIGKLVWGIPGIFLAIPLTAMVKIVCDHYEPLKPYGFLIGEIKGRDKLK
jgi:predicted PurR-regulated permease PerM